MEDGSGNFHFTSHIFESMTGVGSFGNKYRFFASDHPTVNYTNGATAAHFVGHEFVVSAGSGDNFVATSLFHVTVTPSGELVVSFDISRLECRG